MKKRSVVFGLIISFVLLLSATGCDQITQPEQKFQTPCSQINTLTCRSSSATGGIFCCMNNFNQNAATGYACILGKDRFAGCYNSLAQARQLGCGGTVVRCVRE